MNKPPSARKLTLTHLLLGAIAVLLGVIAFRPAPPKGNAKTDTPPAKAGASNPQKPLAEEFKPTKVDTTRLIQTYAIGKSYRSIVHVSLTSRGTNKDWGIAADNTFAYVGEMVVDRTVESNDGTKMVLVQEFFAAKTLTAVTQIEGIRIELPPVGTLMLEGLGQATAWMGGVDIPRGWSTVLADSANLVLENPLARNLIATATRDNKAKIFRFIDSIEKKRMKVEFTNGSGATNIIPIGGDLTGEEADLVRLMNYSCDATILPLDSKPGDTWTLRGADLMALIDPSMKATPTGLVTAQRLEDKTVGDRSVARIEIIKGVLDMLSTTKKDFTSATWAPRGTLEYDFKDRIITSAELDGELIIQNRSTDHIIFEASWSQKPKYKVVYHCELKK